MSRILPFSIGFLSLTAIQLNYKRLYQSPTFQGVPVAGTLLIHQATPLLNKQFPGLEISGIFAPGNDGHSYSETTTLGIYPTACKVTIPIYERLSEQEEERLGKALLMKPIVGMLVMFGKCNAGCATASLQSLVVYKVTKDKKIDYENVVWKWNK